MATPKESDGSAASAHKEVPTDALEALARMLYPAMVAYYESDAGRREFAEWQVEQGRASSPAEGGAAERAGQSETAAAKRNANAKRKGGRRGLSP